MQDNTTTVSCWMTHSQKREFQKAMHRHGIYFGASECLRALIERYIREHPESPTPAKEVQ